MTVITGDATSALGGTRTEALTDFGATNRFSPYSGRGRGRTIDAGRRTPRVSKGFIDYCMPSTPKLGDDELRFEEQPIPKPLIKIWQKEELEIEFERMKPKRGCRFFYPKQHLKKLIKDKSPLRRSHSAKVIS